MSTTTAVLYGADAVGLANKICPAQWRVDDTVVISLLRGDVLHGAVIINNWQLYSVELTFVFVNNPIVVSEFVETIYKVIFEDNNKLVAIMKTAMDNKKMVRLHERLGHSFAGIIHHQFGENQPGLLFTIDKHGAIDKWIKRFCK